ncbi:hypothetical protein G5V59_20900 [Nocardioides sp. W3-2-3]|nr:hypothetical protein [Nocardioides convexus]
MYPCLAGVRWHLQSGNVATSDASAAIGQIRTAYGRKFPNTVYYAAAGSRTDLYQVAFSGLQFCTAKGAPVSTCPTAGTTDIQAVRRQHGRSRAQGREELPAHHRPRPGHHHRRSGRVDRGARDGGQARSRSRSRSRRPPRTWPAGWSAAPPAAASWASAAPASLSASDFAGGLAQWLGGGKDYTLLGINLDLYYLVTHRENASDPYTQVPVDGSGNPLNSIQAAQHDDLGGLMEQGRRGTRWRRMGALLGAGLGTLGALATLTWNQVLGFDATLVIQDGNATFSSSQITADDAAFGMAPVRLGDGTWKNVLRAGFASASLDGLCVSKTETIAGGIRYTLKAHRRRRRCGAGDEGRQRGARRHHAARRGHQPPGQHAGSGRRRPT